MLYIILLIFFFLSETIYFNIAEKYKIIDKPNARSLHTNITIRGGGIVFLVSMLFYFFYSNFEHPLFFLGLTAIALISFLDDIFTLPNSYRLPFQFLAIILILTELHFFTNPIWLWTGVLIIGVGIINAYNFMDGINGITGGYSTIILMALWVVNNYHLKFIENDFLIFTLLGLMVFNYFNFRTKARCFAGDVGSISMAVIIVFLLLKLIMQDHNLIYILFLAVYGVDSILTIIHRLWLKENIFKAHRLHLFQVLVHTLKIPHLVMSSIYMLIQSIICYIIIVSLDYSFYTQLIVAFSLISLLVLSYMIIKCKVMTLAV
jgi:UDP-N-acetylmuramyl pentapeptide phosphotransferase/UDP-N-acetylglucosamine-1-phosphate transferase